MKIYLAAAVLVLSACATTPGTPGVERMYVIWINHDMEQHATIPKAPQHVE